MAMSLAKRAQRKLWGLFHYAPIPSTIFLVVNNRCNLFCRMCDVGKANREGRRPGETDNTFSRNLMTRDEIPVMAWMRLIDDVARYKPLIAVTSTEPLLYPGLLELIEYCHSRGLKVQVTTNGLLLERFVEPFLERRLDYLWVSIDGPPEVHDTIRGVKGAFEKAIKPMHEIMERRQGKTPFVGVNYTICDLNFDRLVETLDYVKCDQLNFSHLNFVTEEMAEAHNARCRYKVTPAGLKDVSLEAIDLTVLWNQIRQVKATRKDYRITFAPELSRDELYIYYRKPMLFLPGRTTCNAIWTIGQILADGNLTGSTRCFDSARLGNIQQQSFTALWNGTAFREFRKYLKEAGGSYPACARCCGIF